MININKNVIAADELEKKLEKKVINLNMPSIKNQATNFNNINDLVDQIDDEICILKAYQELKDPEIKAHGHFKKIKVLLKRFSRKMTHFMFQDIYERQSTFNEHTIEVLERIRDSLIGK
ncbi:MAG TPA: hypothetical protein DDW20_01860 [Firmicutes bacterium]|nr:hypothetical protein [Bacillota bacterium]